MQKILFTACALLSAFWGFAQKTELNGTLLDENQAPLEMANVLVQNAQDSSMVTYGFTDADGQFRFKLPTGKKYLLAISYLGYRSRLVPVTLSGESQNLTIELEPDTETLAEVEVVDEMPVVITGDTISYKADAFTTGQEQKLEDVLKRLPGVEVDEDGQVKVEGKTVEKVMVEGKDFFDGDSKIATKNIPADAVDKVQVVRNYEEVQPLAGLSTEDRVALNIKLKEGKKNLWFGDYEAKVGDPERYLAHTNAFFYSPKASFNVIGDINNLGKPAFTLRDYFRFSGGFRNLANRSGSNFQFAIDDIGIPLGQNNRAENMVSRFGAANFNYSPSKKLTVSGFFIVNESVISSPYTTTRTYIGLDSLNGTENLDAQNHQHPLTTLGKVSAVYKPDPSLQVNYDAFAKYSNQRNSTGLFSDFGDFQNDLTTRSRQEPYELKQELGFFKEAGKSVYRVEAQYLIKRQDPTFALSSNQPLFVPLFTELRDSLTLFNNLVQNQVVNSRQFQGSASYYYILNGKNHLELSAGTNLNNQDFESALAEGEIADQQAFPDSVLNNQADFSLNDYFAGLHWKAKLGKFTIRPGVNFHNYQIFDAQNGTTETQNYNLVLPDAFVRYAFGKSENLTLRYSLQAQFFDINQVFDGIILQSYNSLFQGSNDLRNATLHNLNLSYFKFDMFNFTNIFASLNYSRTLDGVTNAVDYLFQGRERVFTPINSPGFNENFTASGSWSRKFEYFKTDARLSYSYNNTNNQVDRRNNNNSSFNQGYTAGIGTNFEKWPNLDVNYNFTHNNYLGANTSSTFTNHRPSFELTAVVFKDFVLRGEYTYNNYGNPGADDRTSFDFLDARVEYQKEGSPWLFSLQGLNLLNTQFIREDGLSDNLITTTAYTVLPRYLLAGVRYDL